MRPLLVDLFSSSTVLYLTEVHQYNFTSYNNPPEARGLCFCPVLFYFFISLLVYAVKVAGTVGNLGDLVLGREVTQAPAGG